MRHAPERLAGLRMLLLATVAAVPATAWAQPSPAAQPGTADAIRVLLDQAIYLRGRDQPRAADEALSRVLALDPRNADALALRAQAAAEAGDEATARDTLARLQAVRPDDPRIEAIRQALRVSPQDKTALADARRFANAGQPEAAVAAYRKLFRGELPPPGLAVEYYQALGGAEAEWAAARDSLAARLRANPQDLRGQLAYAELLVYHDPTRAQGIDRLHHLTQTPSLADQANADLRLADLAHTAPTPATLPALPPPASPPPSQPAVAHPSARPERRSEAADTEAATTTTATVLAEADEPVSREYEPYAPAAQPVLLAQAAPARSLLLTPVAPGTAQTAPPALAPGSLPAPAAPPPAATPAADPALTAPYNNPFRTQPLTPDEPQAPIGGLTASTPAARAPADPVTAEIDRSIEQVQQSVAPAVQGSLSFRGRSGDSGLSQLFDLEAPVEASFSPAGYGRLKVSVTPVVLWTGSASNSDRQFVGTNPLLSGSTTAAAASTIFPGTSTSQAGAALNVGYAYGPVSADIGSTPLGFREGTVVGGVQFAPRLTDNITLRVTGERRVVTDSLLSYAGLRDPQTGVTWGGVTRNRGYVQFEDLIGNFAVYAGAGGAAYLGDHVQDNAEIEAQAGFTVPVWTTPTQEVRVGTNLIYFGFNRNLGNFTLGQGGYFSPQYFLAGLIPVQYREQLTPDLVYTLGGSIGVQAFRSKSEAVFPNDPGLQSQLEALAAGGAPVATRFGGSHEIGPAGGARGEVDYRVNDSLHIGASAGFDRAGNFTEGTGLVYARYVFNGAD